MLQCPCTSQKSCNIIIWFNYNIGGVRLDRAEYTCRKLQLCLLLTSKCSQYKTIRGGVFFLLFRDLLFETPRSPHMVKAPQTRLRESAGRWAGRNRRCPLQSECKRVCVCVCVLSQMTYQLRIPVVLFRWWWMVGGGGGGDMQRQCADSPEGEPRLLGPGGRGRGVCRRPRGAGAGCRRPPWCGGGGGSGGGVVWGPLLRSLPSVMHLPSGWQQAWSGVRWSEHGLSGAVT